MIGPRYLYEMFSFREMTYDLRNSHTIIPFNYNNTTRKEIHQIYRCKAMEYAD